MSLAVWYLSPGTWPVSDQFQQRHSHPLLNVPLPGWLPLWFHRREVKCLLLNCTLSLLWRTFSDYCCVLKDPREQLPCLQSFLLRLRELPDGSVSGDFLPSAGRKERVPQLGAWYWRNEARVSIGTFVQLVDRVDVKPWKSQEYMLCFLIKSEII